MSSVFWLRTVRMKMESSLEQLGLCVQVSGLFLEKITRIWLSFFFLWKTSFTFSLNRPFPNCLVPLFQSEASCKTFHMKMSFICMWMKTQFHKKGYARRLALKTRYKTTRKWPVHVLGAFRVREIVINLHRCTFSPQNLKNPHNFVPFHIHL